MNVLVSLHKGYGLGDAVQMSSVLRHVRKYRPEWTTYYRAELGKECVGNSLVFSTHTYEDIRIHDINYDAEVQITLYDRWYGFNDKPNTHVTQALKEHFDIPWDKECSRYWINVSEDKAMDARSLLDAVKPEGCLDKKVVAIHYQGKTAQDRKNLTDEQAFAICNHVSNLGYVPVLLDWNDYSSLRYVHRIPSVGQFANGSLWGGDAEFNAAIISQCAAFVGIDSGPAKCASATETPSLVVWTKHHPAQFHDPASNTTHLTPVNYHSLFPVLNNKEVINWFESNYITRQYNIDPVSQVKSWLEEVLR